MSVTTTAPVSSSVAQYARFLRYQHCTVSVTTRNSNYLVVNRPQFGVRIVCPDGRTLAGATVRVSKITGHMSLCDASGRLVFETSTVISVYVLSN